MAFVNEYTSEEDMKKYEIRDVWKKLYGDMPDETLDAMQGRGYCWTVDKERDFFLIRIKSGQFEESNHVQFALRWKGGLLSVTVANVGSHLDYPARTGSVKWDLLQIWKPKGFAVPDTEIISILKEALTVYELDGIRHPMNSYPVSFTF